jgi:ABC-type polysaccharide/polyol phosphate export permease
VTSALGKASPLRYSNLIWNFAQRDLKSRFKGTALGWAWSLLLPLGSLVIYGLVFGIVLKVTPPPFADGRAGNFAVYLFTGLVVWQFFSGGVLTAMNSLVATGSLLKKIYFPAYAPVVGAILSVGVQSLLELGVVMLVLVLFANVGWTWLLLPLWAAGFLLFVAGVATILAILNVRFRDLTHIIAVTMQLLFYTTPIIIPLTQIPTEAYGLPLRWLIGHSPLGVFVELFRELTYTLSVGSVSQWAQAFGWAAASLALGALVYHRSGKDLGEEL